MASTEDEKEKVVKLLNRLLGDFEKDLPPKATYVIGIFGLGPRRENVHVSTLGSKDLIAKLAEFREELERQEAQKLS